MRRCRVKYVLVTMVLLAASAVAPAVAAVPVRFSPGAPGLGDPYFPLEGNGGYQPSHYDLDLSYDPALHHLSGVATMRATATQNLSRFDLDLQGLTVRGVQVNDRPASFTRNGSELVITPQSGLPAARPFVVAVTYGGSPQPITGSPILGGAEYGWIYTDDGVVVATEPDAASTWFPSDDHPSRKATFTFRVTVPADRSVVANGDLIGYRTSGDHATYVWNETSPMATYLATIDIGKWQITQGRTPGGIRNIVAVDPTLDISPAAALAASAEVTDYFAKVFGPYPFTSTGAILDNAPDLGISLETQTRPVYYTGIKAEPGDMAHELSHQWFGDSVSVADWSQTWLNEGFAMFATYLWIEHAGGETTWQSAADVYDIFSGDPGFWARPVPDPGRDAMFGFPIYNRGLMTLALLRHKMGDTRFFQLLRTWLRTHRYGNATTAQFTALASQIAGQDLTPFFQTWLWQPTQPPWPA